MRPLVLLSALLFLAASIPALAWQQSSDDKVHDAVMQKLAGDRDVRGGGLDVEVRDGVVTLRGKIRDEKQKGRAERLTRKVKGVKQVNNELRVEAAGVPQT
jgi:osmotically-inducible protein OsmY